MSFIDYNFFPILFFLGWNILTTKQFKPTNYITSDSRTLSKLSTLPLTNSINQKTLQSHSKHEKDSNILEFIPEFKFLSENQKLMGIPRASILYLEDPTNDPYMLKNISTKKADTINYVTKPIKFKWILNEDKKYYFTNSFGFVNNNWAENFKSNFFDFTYRPKTKRSLFSFFPYKIKTVSPKIKSSFNLASLFSNQFENGIFFTGLCSSQNDSFWKKTQKQLNYTWFFTKIPYSSFLSSFLKNPTKDPSVLQKHTFEHRISLPKKETIKNNNNDYHHYMSRSSYLTLEKNIRSLKHLNWIQKKRSKIRLLLRTPNQKVYSLNQFQIPLCFSKILQPPIFFHDSSGFNLTSKVNDSKFNHINNELEPVSQVSEISSLQNAFVKFDKESDYVENYKRKKKNWYMKTQFFQHIASNMTHKISDHFDKDINETAPTFTPLLLKNSATKEAYTFYQNDFLRIYGGSWYYENLIFPYRILNTIAKTFSPKMGNFNKNTSQNKLSADHYLKFPILDEKCMNDNYQTLLNIYLNNNSYNHKKHFFSFKLPIEFESDIGIYSLAHKLSSVGFRNANSEIDIYPFKYNDSYRYNFQNMNLSNQRLKSFFSEQDFITDKSPYFPNFKKFLDFQNPTFSKIYAPLFQPQGLNLLSFI